MKYADCDLYHSREWNSCANRKTKCVARNLWEKFNTSHCPPWQGKLRLSRYHNILQSFTDENMRMLITFAASYNLKRKSDFSLFFNIIFFKWMNSNDEFSTILYHNANNTKILWLYIVIFAVIQGLTHSFTQNFAGCSHISNDKGWLL